MLRAARAHSLLSALYTLLSKIERHPGASHHPSGQRETWSATRKKTCAPMARVIALCSLHSALYKKIPRRMHRWQVIQKGTVGYFILRTMASVIMTGDPCHDTSETLVSADAMSADMLL